MNAITIHWWELIVGAVVLFSVGFLFGWSLTERYLKNRPPEA